MIVAYLSRLVSRTAAAAAALTFAAVPAPATFSLPLPLNDPHLVARAVAESTGKAVSIGMLTTGDSTTVANPDGSFSLSTSALPTRMRDAAGGWVGIDPTLRRGPDGSIATVATPNALTLSAGGTGPLASIADHAGHLMALSLPVRLPAPVLSGASATYADVYRGVDLVVTAQPSGGFGEVLVAHDAAAASAAAHLRFATSLRGLTLRAGGAGDLRAVDAATGQAVMTAPPTAMWDSAATGPENDLATAAISGPGGPGRNAHVAPLPIHVDSGGLTLDAAPPADTTYPLYLDPSWTLPFTSAGRQHYGEVQGASGCQTFTTFDNISQPGVGYNDFDSCVGPYRTFYTVDTSALASNFQITSSTLKIDEVMSALNSCGQGSETITVKWTAGISSGLDWSNQPKVDSRGDPITSKSLKSVGNTAGTMCSGGTVPGDFDMSSAIKPTAQGNLDTLTFGLYGNETPGSHSLERFNNNPSILTQYDIPPNTPDSLAASPTPVDSGGAADQGCGSAAAGFMGISNIGGTHRATLSARLISGTRGAQMDGVFTIHDDTAGANVAVPTSTGFVTSGASVSVGTPILTDGHQYSWSLHANDQYFDSATSATCKFVADETAPLDPTITSTDFPAAGSGVASTKTNGQAGQLILTSSDPNPNNGHGSGMKGFEYSLDSPVPSSGATVTPSSGSLTVSVTPPQWGTHTLYAEAVDNAGNVSGQSRYSFYVPWNPATKVMPGDVSGDGIPDLVTTTSGGNLVTYLGNADPAGSPLTLGTPTSSPDGLGTSWNQFLVTHRGSFTNQGVDDLWAFGGPNHGLYLYKNVGPNPFQNTGNVVPITKADVVQDAVNISPTSPDNASTACATTTTGSCAGYDNTDWSTVTQILAVGDFYAGTPVATNDNSAPGLLTVEGGSLWYYQGQTTQFYLGTAIQLGTSGWDGVTLLAPGTVGGKPTLWARDNTTGAILQYAITFDNTGFPVNLGTPSSGTALTIPGGAIFSKALYPSAISPGDLRGSGFPDLVVTTTAGRVIDYPGAAPTSAGLATFASPVPLGAVSGVNHEWPLTDGSGTTAADTAGGASAALSSGASWTTDAARGTVVAVDGSSGYVTLPQQLISGGSSLTLSVTFRAAAGTTGILASTGHDVPANLSTGAMPVMYIGTDGRLYAQFWNGAVEPLISPAAVNDGAWHTAVLSAADTIQTLYLDSRLIRSQTGAIQNLDPLDFVGGGVFNTDPWVNAPGGTTATHASYFTGDLSDVRFWASGQSAAQLGVSPGEVDFASDQTIYPSGSAWYSPLTTMTFENGLITLADAATGRVVETWGTTGYPNATLTLQTDGNLVVYDGTNALWALQHVRGAYSSGDVMKLLANGNLVVVTSSGALIWQAASRANPGSIVFGGQDMCVDNNNGTATSGNRVQVWSCAGNSNQTWLLGGDGTVRFNGNPSFCMEVAGSGTGNGTRVDLGSCSGGANQTWQARTGGELVNPNSGRCLDDPASSITNGTQLDIWDCVNGAANESWETPGV